MAKDTKSRNIAKLFLPFVFNSSIPIILIRIPSNKDNNGPCEKSFVINPYIEIATTIIASIILMIFNSIAPQTLNHTQQP